MSQPSRRVLTATAAIGTAVVVSVFAFLWWRDRPLDTLYWLFLFHHGPPAVLLLWLSRLVLLRRPGNAAGRVLFAIGVLSAVQTVIAAVVDTTLVAAGVSDVADLGANLEWAALPFGAKLPVFVMNVHWVPATVLTVVVLPLLFPDGRLPGRRWVAALWLAGVGAGVLMVANGIDAWPWSSWATPEPPPIVGILTAIGGACVLVAAVAGFVAVALRWRRTPVAERQPFRMVAWATLLFATSAVATYPWPRVWVMGILLWFYVALAAYALAIARFRTRELERQAGRADVVSRLAATTVDTTSYDPLSDSVELLARSTSAARAEAWRHDAGAARLVAAWGTEVVGEPSLTAPIRYDDAELGELRVYAQPGLDLPDDAPTLARDVANVLAFALHSMQQSADLAGLSRRLIEAHDTARRSIERDLHDGVQAQLTSIRLRLGALADVDSGSELRKVAHEVDAAIGSLRDLVQGIDPPALRRSGLLAALALQSSNLGVPVTVRADQLGRYDPAIEAAVYFACLEALANAARHANAEQVSVLLAGDEDGVRFRVCDDGVGFDPSAVAGTGLPGITDRIRAFGGTLRIDSRPGSGTVVEGFVPSTTYLASDDT